MLTACEYRLPLIPPLLPLHLLTTSLILYVCLHDVSYLQNVGWSPLIMSAYDGNIPLVNVLLKNGANVNQTSNDGNSSLHVAVLHDQKEVVALLLSNGANINQADNDGASPLHYAAENGHDALVANLIEKGADVNQVDVDGDRPIDVAKTQKIKDMLIALTEEKREDEGQPAGTKVVDEAQWFRAAKKGKLALIQQGINDKIDVNCRDSTGCTALYVATQRDHISVVEYLFSQGADVSIPTVCANVASLSTRTSTPLTSSNSYPDFIKHFTPTLILYVA